MLYFKKKVKEEKLKLAYEKGREAGDALFTAIDDYLNWAIPRISQGQLASLRKGFESIYSIEAIDAKVVAEFDFQNFRKEISSCYHQRLRKAVYETLTDWIDVAKTLNVIDLIDEQIDKRASSALEDLLFEATIIYTEVIALIESKPRNA